MERDVADLIYLACVTTQKLFVSMRAWHETTLHKLVFKPAESKIPEEKPKFGWSKADIMRLLKGNDLLDSVAVNDADFKKRLGLFPNLCTRYSEPRILASDKLHSLYEKWPQLRTSRYNFQQIPLIYDCMPRFTALSDRDLESMRLISLPHMSELA